MKTDCPNAPDLWQLSARQMRDLFAAGQVTPVDTLRSCLARMDHANPSINAITIRRDAAALDEAEASRRRYAAGKPLSPLDGVPITIKDCLPTHDMPTTWGTVMEQDHIPARDEQVVRRCREAGAVIVGKTNVCEFTLEGYTGNARFGITRNPWNTALTPGGSSGGAVASIAAGITPLALGTDAGGSIRRPASHCGIVGFKPSIGAIARVDALPAVALDFEVVGPMARTVEDIALCFEVLRGPDPADRLSLAAHAADHAHPDDRPLRILYVPSFKCFPVDPQIAASCLRAMDRFRALGHIVEIGPMPFDLEFTLDEWPIVGKMGLAHLLATHPLWRNGASERYLQMAQDGAAQPATRLLEILDGVGRIRRNAYQTFKSIDLIVTPSTAALPWPAKQVFPTKIDGQPVGPRGHAIFAAWVNAAGLPAIAVPTEPSECGLPIGIQMVSAFGTDTSLLKIARAYEDIAGWAQSRPPEPAQPGA